MTTTALITGVNGFCGRHLSSHLNSIGGVRVLGIDLSASPPNNLTEGSYRRINIANYDEVEEVVRWAKPDMVFHLAGQIGGPATQLYSTNVLGSVNLFEAVKQVKPDARILHIGSAAEYGIVNADLMPVSEDFPCAPVGPYGLSKHAATEAALDYARREKLKITVARPFNIIGAGVSTSVLVGAIIRRVRDTIAGAPHEPDQPLSIEVGRIDTSRDFIAIQDVVAAYMALIQGEFWGEIFNICSGQAVPISDVVSRVLSFSTRKISYRINPAFVRADDPPVFFGARKKALDAFGFEPRVNLDQALQEAWDDSGGSNR